ncbi:V-type ATP synthase subunit E family protein [Candidatus Omnitrophota bacterium]
MSDKLAKLTKQIYDEGVQKAKQEADKIVSSAKNEQENIVRLAQKQAHDIQVAAQKEADALKKRVESELRMASQQSLTLLRQKIAELICTDVSQSSAKGIFDDTDFLKKIIETVLKSWAGSGCQDKDLFLKLPKNVKKDMQGFFEHKTKQNMDKGLSVTFDEKIKSGFIISPKDGSYRIGFTEEDFQALIENFLRPQMKTFLFEKNR